MPLDFPSNPSDGQVYEDYYYDSIAGVWQSNNGTQVPNIFKNVEYTTAQTYLTPVTIKGKAGQTADLQQWTDSQGNVLASIDSTGEMTVQSLVSVQPIVSIPTGSLLPYAGTSAPEYFLLCQGQAISRTVYSSLFAVLGTTYGVGDNSTTFNLPNLMGKVPVGKDATQTEFDVLGETGGAKTHTLTTSEMPSHTHVQDSHNHSQNPHSHSSNAGEGSGNGPVRDVAYGAGDGYKATYYTPSLSINSTTATNNAATATNQNTGGGLAHNNLQPYLVTNYIIKT